MAAQPKKSALKFDVSPDSVTFHLLEAAAAPTHRSGEGFDR
jgi:hypothetical protein